MALKNRDGTDFKLNKPNPIMADQRLWEKEGKLIFHNKIGKSVILPDETRPVKPIVFDSQVIEKAKEVLKPTQEPVVVRQLEEPEVGNEIEDKVQIWCLPASYREYKDDLYGEKFRKIKYGNKFLFEAISLEQDDLTLMVWTNTKAVTEGSILFPRSHDKRWWRVQSIKEQDGGYIVCSMISDYQPKFSD